ncbi:ferrochelatase [Micropruina sonneratiae]|uniref:ferrochelatase n=1 Tax=Micropruina sonneratiae TaxID=2986940 RepID=UPI0022269B5A|nr:ferrochelatase [Micropruina sp. KQZ13P-5]MCW3159358.1 ferrochelatase [Micropruina sp. KQZ13P-5]
MSPLGSKPAPAEGVHLSPGAAVPSATPGAASGPEHVEVPTRYDAVLLSGFGGPEGQDDVIPFLRNVTRGRGIPDERLEEVAHHYRHFDGVSPINGHNRELRSALEHRLAERGLPLPVLWGNRNWKPYLNDAVADAFQRGLTTLIAIPTSAYSSYSSCRQYREDWADALADTGLADRVLIDKVRPFFNHPGFVQPFIEGVTDAVAAAAADGIGADELEVLFCTHSIPTGDAATSGGGGMYPRQHEAVAEYVMATAAPEVAWQLVYQSRSGPPHQPWLEPDVNDAIAALTGRRGVILVPVGFVSDHMEVMWDLDTEAVETATDAGLWVRRTPTPGVHPAFVDALADLVAERIEGRPAAQRAAVSSIGPWFDVCRPGCCANKRLGFRPAIAGLAP